MADSVNSRANIKKRIFSAVNFLLMFAITLSYMVPFYIAIVFSFKTDRQIAKNPLAFPLEFHFENYTRAIEVSNFFHSFKNSLIVTVVGVIIVVVVSAQAAYVIARNNNRFYNFFYYLFLASIMVPFQVVMFPLYKNFFQWGLVSSLPGLILALSGFQVGFNVFLYTGFVKSVPREMEESATIDGCGQYRAFWSIIFPMMKPINVTVAVLTSLAFWNDFLLSLIFVNNDKVRTLPLVQYYFIGQYNVELPMAFAAVIMMIVPILIFYILAQKYIVSGVTSGAMKG